MDVSYHGFTHVCISYGQVDGKEGLLLPVCLQVLELIKLVSYSNFYKECKGAG